MNQLNGISAQSIRRFAINAFVILYCYVLFWWLVYPTPLRTALLRPFASTVVYIGMWQGWGVFSPNIRRTSMLLGANITYDDSVRRVWEFPRIDKCSLIDKLFLERYRKFGYDHANWDQHKYMYPDYARFVARAAARPQHSITKIELFKYYFDLLPMEREMSGERDPQHFIKYFVFKPERGEKL